MKKVVIVTGGGRGIGAATAKLLAKQGYQVCVNYRVNAQRAEAIVAEISAAGGQAFSMRADVSSENEVIALFDATERQFGPVTHLVNNAGILFSQSAFAAIDVERFQKVMLANVTSCFLCCREFIRRNTSTGAIVNVSSAAARTGSPFEYVDYA
ncbi:MAG: SDR family NAD(P)-dependent oxidoreductase, partial [Gammaproteobacteria bacterium]|nr:SDR family NAD(P)-dependent oxidoreductase [Gammaproteobacteria bacterium]